MTPLPVSVCMISGAEAHRIGRALASVAGWTREQLVVLNAEVQDGTEEAAPGARIFREPWKGYIAQKNSAAEKATQPWLLGLDADEVVSPELRREITQRLAEESRGDRHAAFSFPRCTFYCGRWIRHGDWYPDRTIRLWRRGRAHWAGIDPHARLEVNGPLGRLGSDLLHFSNESIDRQIAKIAPFSADFVRHHLDQGRSASVLDLAVRPAWRFLRAYLLRRGFLDGWQGFYIAGLTAFSTLTRYAKVREAQTATPTSR